MSLESVSESVCVFVCECIRVCVCECVLLGMCVCACMYVCFCLSVGLGNASVFPLSTALGRPCNSDVLLKNNRDT